MEGKFELVSERPDKEAMAYHLVIRYIGINGFHGQEFIERVKLSGISGAEAREMVQIYNVGLKLLNLETATERVSTVVGLAALARTAYFEEKLKKSYESC